MVQVVQLIVIRQKYAVVEEDEGVESFPIVIAGITTVEKAIGSLVGDSKDGTPDDAADVKDGEFKDLSGHSCEEGSTEHFIEGMSSRLKEEVGDVYIDGSDKGSILRKRDVLFDLN